MKCAYVKADGEHCQANSMKNSEFCFSHNPATKEKHALAVVKGGKMSRRNRLNLPSVPVRNPEDVINVLEEAINGVRSGVIPPNIANTLAFICSHALRAMEASNLDERLEIVESVLMQRKTVKRY